MEKQVKASSQVVYIVTCYQNVVGVYSILEDAVQVSRDLIGKNRPADILTRNVV